jgi:CheY-like chemotaxis protein
MGGLLSYDSVFGKGACFYLELPVCNTKMVSHAPGHADGPRLLLVEDEPDASLLLQQMLGNAGFNADIVTTGAQALAAIKACRYAGILLDLQLPDMNGIDIIRRLKSEPATAEVPIIVVSAYSEDGKLMINGDFSDIVWLPKPVDKTRLSHLLELLSSSHQLESCQVLHVEEDPDLTGKYRSGIGQG